MMVETLEGLVNTQRTEERPDDRRYTDAISGNEDTGPE